MGRRLVVYEVRFGDMSIECCLRRYSDIRWSKADVKSQSRGRQATCTSNLGRQLPHRKQVHKKRRQINNTNTRRGTSWLVSLTPRGEKGAYWLCPDMLGATNRAHDGRTVCATCTSQTVHAVPRYARNPRLAEIHQTNRISATFDGGLQMARLSPRMRTQIRFLTDLISPA